MPGRRLFVSHLWALIVGVALGSSLAVGPLNPVAIAAYSLLLVLFGWTVSQWIGQGSDDGGLAGPVAKQNDATEKPESLEGLVSADAFECPAMATERTEVIIPADGCERCDGDPRRCPACRSVPT